MLGASVLGLGVGLVACAGLLDIPERYYAGDAGIDAGIDDGLDAGGSVDVVSTIPDSQPPIVPIDCRAGIKVRLLLDATGATSGVSVPYFYGELDYLRELNVAGGIKGCPIQLEYADYGYDPAKAQLIYDGWKASPDWAKIVAIFGFGSGDTLQLAPHAREDKKPLISASYFGGLAAPDPVDINVSVPELSGAFDENSFPTHLTSDGFPYNFFTGTDYSTGIRIAMFHVKTLGGKRVGFFHCDQAYCAGPIPAGRTYAKAQGLSLGRDLIVQLTEDQTAYDKKVHDYFVQEVEHAKQDGAYSPVDWIWMGNTTKTTAYLAKAIDNLKTRVRPPSTWGQTTDDAPDVQTLLAALNVQIIVNNWGFDEMLFTLCGAACVNRVHGIVPFTAFGDTTRGSTEMPKVVALHDKWRALDAKNADAGAAGDGGVPSYKNVRYVQGYVSAMAFRLAVERAIAAGGELTGPSLKSAFESFKQVDTGGLADKLSYGVHDHRPQSTETIYKIAADGKLVPEPPSRTISLDDKWLGW